MSLLYVNNKKTKINKYLLSSILASFTSYLASYSVDECEESSLCWASVKVCDKEKKFAKNLRKDTFSSVTSSRHGDTPTCWEARKHQKLGKNDSTETKVKKKKGDEDGNTCAEKQHQAVGLSGQSSSAGGVLRAL